MSIAEYKAYFKNSGDTDSHIFNISDSPYPAMFYNESFKFGDGKHKIRIIDQFDGKRPLLLNYDFCAKEKQLQLFFAVSIVMDSNLVSLLHQYVTCKESMRADVKSATKDFLIHVSKIKCDYTPLFYLIESYAKNNKSDYLLNASNTLASILKLHTMHEEKFIATGEITPRKEQLDHYCNLYNASNIEECGKNWAQKSLTDNRVAEHKEIIDLTYACLLKMVLINFQDGKGIYKKSERFETFLVETLGVVLARELNLSLYYFAGLAGKFINTQPNMKLPVALANLKATAWDISLLRYPEYLLSPTCLPEITTAYIATSEEKLYDLGKLFTIENLAYNDKNETPLPVVSFNMHEINDKVGDNAVSKLSKKGNNLPISRLLNNQQAPIKYENLKMLINDLKIQMSNLCQG